MKITTCSTSVSFAQIDGRGEALEERPPQPSKIEEANAVAAAALPNFRSSRREAYQAAMTTFPNRGHPGHQGSLSALTLLSMVLGIAVMSCLIASLVRSLVFVFFELSLLGVVTMMRVVIASVAHA
jgi:hypothetical protein